MVIRAAPKRTEYDSITNRTYIYLDDSEFQIVKYNNQLIASYKGEIRFIDENNILNIVKTEEPLNSANVLEFYLDLGHTRIKFDCEKCDNQSSHSFFYDFDGKINKQSEFTEAHNYNKAIPSPLKLYLNYAQADIVYKTISKLYNLSINGGYKYVPIIHDCVSLLTDVYKQSGFPGHFADYHTDTELLKSLMEGEAAFIHKHYYPDYEEIIHPQRVEISSFIKSIYGNGYSIYWYYCNELQSLCESLGLESSGISGATVNYQKALLNPGIANLLKEVMQIKEEVIPQLFAIGLSVWDGYHNFSAKLLQNYLHEVINAPITYHDLHYTYVLNHKLKIANLFKDTIYAKEVVDLFYPSHKVSDDYYGPINDANELITYHQQCNAGYTEIWGDINQ